MILSLLLLVFVIIWTVYYRWSRRRIYQLSKQIICGLNTLPFIGHAHLFLGGGTGRMKAIQLFGRETITQGGMTYAWLGPEFFIVLADIDNMETVMKSCLEKHDVIRFIGLATDNGSLFAPVSIWRRRRKLIAPAFNLKYLKTFVEVFSKQSSIMVSLLKQAPKGSFPIWDYFVTYAKDSIFESAMGYDYKAQKNQSQICLKALEVCTRLAAERMCKPWLYPLAVYKMTPQYAMFMKYKKAVRNFSAQAVMTITQEIKDRREDPSNKRIVKKLKPFLELFINHGGDNGLTELELEEEAVIFVAAATDTSAVTASFISVMLSRHQDVQEKVYQEVLEVLGDKHRPIAAEDLPRLKYLDAVIRETLRLHPPVPIIVRKTETDVALRITLMKGCGIVIHIWAIQRDPKYWGPDAEDFRPERFFEHYDRRAFMAFSSGPRNCVGYQYAMMSMKTVLASLIRQYRVLPAEEDIIHDGLNTKFKPIQETFEITTKDDKNFMVKLARRI